MLFCGSIKSYMQLIVFPLLNSYNGIILHLYSL